MSQAHGHHLVAVLYARADSHYKETPWADVWDAGRDALRWTGGLPVVAHPPCRAWGRLRHFAKPREDEKSLALDAVRQVRRWGGVLEHPASSTLWAAAKLPRPGEVPDKFGGYSIEVDQVHWGHRAQKRTWLYIVGCRELPHLPRHDKVHTAVVRPRKGAHQDSFLTKREREMSPPAFAKWLLAIALRTRPRRRGRLSFRPL